MKENILNCEGMRLVPDTKGLSIFALDSNGVLYRLNKTPRDTVYWAKFQGHIEVGPQEPAKESKAEPVNESSVQEPEDGSLWQHTSKRIYRVLFVTNNKGDADSERRAKYPPTVVYEGVNGKRWSRPLHDWARSMTPYEGDPKGWDVPEMKESMEPGEPMYSFASIDPVILRYIKQADRRIGEVMTQYDRNFAALHAYLTRVEEAVSDLRRNNFIFSEQTPVTPMLDSPSGGGMTGALAHTIEQMNDRIRSLEIDFNRLHSRIR